MSNVLLIGKDSETTRSIMQALADKDCSSECAAGGADAIHRLRRQSFDVLITDPETTIEEDLALIEEMHEIPARCEDHHPGSAYDAGGGYRRPAGTCVRLHGRSV